jgi:hypothetical protein
MLQEIEEDFKHPRLNSDLLAGTAQLAALCVEFVVAEAVDHILYLEAIPRLYLIWGTFTLREAGRQVGSPTLPLGPMLTVIVRIRPKIVRV